MEARSEIEALVGYEGRATGTDAERRAAQHLARRLRALGREAEIEPIAVHPNFGLTHAIHALLAVAGSLVAVGAPLVGFAIVAFTAVSTLGDLTGTLFLVRRLTGRRATQNVSSREDAGKPGVLVLLAHYDAARAGSLFGRRAVERRAALARRLRLPIGLGDGFVLAIALILLCTVLRALGLDSVAVSVVQFVPTVLLVLSVPLLADVQLSAPVPAAGDNASGVAAGLLLAERHGGRLEHFDVWVLLTGAEESMALGMRAWLAAHKAELPKDRTVFLNLDKLAHGTVRFTRREGLVLAGANHPALIELCEEIAGEDEGGRYGARAIVGRGTSDAVAARARGYPAITVSCLASLDYHPHQHQPTDTTDRVDGDALDRGFAFSSALIERIDDELGPEIARSAGQVESGASTPD